MRNVLINGGSRGIGAELVRVFRSNGYNVVFTYLNSANEARILCEQTGSFSVLADSTRESDVIRAVRYAIDTLGSIDCLINNAGVSSIGLFTDLTLDDWNRTIAVNLTGAFLYSREVSRYMISAKQGRIINISSMWGISGASCEVHYSASKAGLIGMTKALAKELGPSSITVNAIAPGVIATEMNSHLNETEMEALRDDTPLMRIGAVSDVASAALFLAGDGASFITGEVLNVSGGFVI